MASSGSEYQRLARQIAATSDPDRRRALAAEKRHIASRVKRDEGHRKFKQIVAETHNRG